MSKKVVLALLCACCMVLRAYTQEDTLSGKTMGEVIVSVNKWEQKINEVPNKIVKVSKQDILRNNPQTSADLLGQTGAVFIQKSQLGGGSPMIRGFATNRVLLVVDGVRMNNAIYRSGNLQNVISIDALSIETAEVIFGPGSLLYGSDAIGGVMDFHTLDARFLQEPAPGQARKKMMVKGSLLTRYSTANQEKTLHMDINLGWKKWSFLSAVSSSRFDDLKMGKYGGQDSYLRPEYVERINNRDSIIKNGNPRVQRFSGYDQLNFLQKIRFRPNPYWDVQYSFTYAKTGEAPRYDRLINYRNGSLRFAEWYYGPMRWQMHNLQVLHNKKTKLFDDARLTVAFQSNEESRIERTRASAFRNRQTEQVDALSANWDASRTRGKAQLFYGLEYVHNKVGSTGTKQDIIANTLTPMLSRYPDGSTWASAGLYSSYKINLHPKVTLATGLRYSYNSLEASFDTTFIAFPYRKASLKDGALTGNTGIVFRPAEGWQLNTNISTGYRMPNVDDIGKLFETVPGFVTVPNPDLQPEYAWNFEAGFIRQQPKHFRFELNGFYTILNHAIVRRLSAFNGSDSILFNGIQSRVETLTNAGKATVAGLQASAEIFLTDNISVQTHANFITGKETDEVNNQQVPLRHAPPFYGSTLLRFRLKKITGEASVQYNGQIKNKDLAPTEQAKTDIYATDANGLPYSPGWYTLNGKLSWQVNNHVMVTAGWENCTNRRYRSYSSGIVAAGSNIIISLRTFL